MKKKWLALLLAAALCLSLLAACGGESGGSESDSGTNSESSGQPDGSSSESSSSSSQGSSSASSQQTGSSSSSSSVIVSEGADAYFQNSVFIGDSVMMGFRNYIAKKDSSFLGGPRFLVSGSYGAANAVAAVSDSSIHPIYEGQQRQVQDSIALMGASKVFICFGINDIALYGIDGTVQNFKTLFERIRAKNPNVQLHILSATPMLSGSEQKNLNNANLRKLNDALKTFATANGAEFIDIYSAVADTDGSLKAAYCSDGFIHQTQAAYDQWVKALRAFASTKL